MKIDTVHSQNLEKIQHIYPETIREWKHFDDGFDSQAYQINKEWVFKIPRRDDVWKRLLVEKEMLNSFHSVSPVQVPHVEFIGDKVLGYRMVQGEPLRDELFRSLSDRNRDKLGEELGLFLSSLHSVEFDAPNSDTYRDHFYRDGFEKLITQAEKSIYPRLPKQTVKNIEIFLAEMREDENNFRHKKAVVHADLHHSHILWDSAKEQLSGIIDFGEMSQNAAIMDLTYPDALYPTENDVFIKRVISSYEFLEDNFLTKIQNFSKFELLYWPMDILWGAELSDSPLDVEDLELFLGYIKSSYGE